MHVLAGIAWNPLIRIFLAHARFDCMAVGVLGAIAVFRQMPVLKLLYSRAVQAAVLLVISANILLAPEAGDTWTEFLMAWPFMILIVNVATNPQSLLRMENRFWNYWGLRSYGLYMWHPLVIFLVVTALEHTGTGRGLPYTIAVFAGSITLSLLAADASYRWLEQPFLRLKGRYATGHSVGQPSVASPPAISGRAG